MIEVISISLLRLLPEKLACRHFTTEYLGSDGVAEFYRCHGCRNIIVVQGPRSWTVKPSISA